MPVPSTRADLTTVAATNSPPGTETAKGNIDNYLRAHAQFIAENYVDVQAAQTTANAALPKAGGTVTGDINLGAGVNVVFEGTTADDYETTLSGGEPTADRTVTLPDATTTLVGTDATQTLTNKTINASQVVDASIKAAKLDGAQSGSAPIFGARAWVNFNGTGTVAIRASGNVSSITDNGTGDYTVNFTTAMQDAKYAAHITVDVSRQIIKTAANGGADPTAAAFRLATFDAAGSSLDATFVNLVFFR